MISVVQRDTARGDGRVGGALAIAGKTGSAQNPHGPAHGWFIGFAPAEKRAIVVGAIVEFAREGPYVAPLVTRVIGRYLGADTTVASNVRIVLPTDTAPRPTQLLPAIPGADTTLMPPPDTGHATPAPRTR